MAVSSRATLSGRAAVKKLPYAIRRWQGPRQVPADAPEKLRVACQPGGKDAALLELRQDELVDVVVPGYFRIARDGLLDDADVRDGDVVDGADQDSCLSRFPGRDQDLPPSPGRHDGLTRGNLQTRDAVVLRFAVGNSATNSVHDPPVLARLRLELQTASMMHLPGRFQEEQAHLRILEINSRLPWRERVRAEHLESAVLEDPVPVGAWIERVEGQLEATAPLTPP